MWVSNTQAVDCVSPSFFSSFMALTLNTVLVTSASLFLFCKICCRHAKLHPGSDLSNTKLHWEQRKKQKAAEWCTACYHCNTFTFRFQSAVNPLVHFSFECWRSPVQHADDVGTKGGTLCPFTRTKHSLPRSILMKRHSSLPPAVFF